MALMRSFRDELSPAQMGAVVKFVRTLDTAAAE